MSDTIDEVKTVESPPPVVNMEYDTPPKEYVPGTVVPKDTAPEDMTNPEWIQWAYQNWMPFWAIKKGLLQRTPPMITSIEPSTAAIGDPSFTLYVTGTNFHTESVIVFAGQSENTTLNLDGTLSTGVNMAYWHGADAVPVVIDNGMSASEPSTFTFTGAAAASALEQDDPPFGDVEDDGKPAKKHKKK
jgi:hypothetical protein